MSKLITSIAGLVIIAAGAYFFWGEYQKIQQGNLNDRISSCRLALNKYTSASISPSQMSSELRESRSVVDSCIDQDLLTREDIINRGWRPEHFFNLDDGSDVANEFEPAIAIEMP